MAGSRPEINVKQWWRSGCAVLLGTLVGCATAPAPAAWQPGNLRPLVEGWPQYFQISWDVTRHDADTLVDGYITNTWGYPSRDVRVLVTGYDVSGRQVGQLIAWGPNAIEPGDRAYFDVTVPAGAATYDVSIFSWRWYRSPSG